LITMLWEGSVKSSGSMVGLGGDVMVPTEVPWSFGWPGMMSWRPPGWEEAEEASSPCDHKSDNGQVGLTTGWLK
jgi:hypothetical protein